MSIFNLQFFHLSSGRAKKQKQVSHHSHEAKT